MTKFLMFLSMAALIGSAVVAGINNRNLSKEQARIAELTEQLTRLNSELDDTQQKLEVAKDENDNARTTNQQAKADLSLSQDDLRRKKAESERLAAQMEDRRVQLEELAILEEKLDGRTPEMVQADLDRLVQNRDSLQSEIRQLEEEVVSVQDEYDKNVQKLGKLDEREQGRREQLALTGIEADIIAINREFGFVILNAGCDQGVSSDSGLLVQRGIDRIGRLRIVSVEPKVTVADIVPGSVNPGVQLMVRDKVIFEAR
ncbi:MAG: hypothetical protein AAF191_08830 [Verrucomicrobiota bacterium]